MTDAVSREHADLLEALAQHRSFLCHTAAGLSDEQAGSRSTVSELCIGGVIKHVTAVEARWAEFIVVGPEAFGAMDEAAYAAHLASFAMTPDDTLEGLLAAYASVAERTAEVIGSLPDLDCDRPLPTAPWWPPGTRWSARMVVLHVIAETAQHAGHADIIREAIDGQKTMG